MNITDVILQQTQSARGTVELIVDSEHQKQVVQGAMLKARTSLDIATADFKAMWVPAGASGSGSAAASIVSHLLRLTRRGVEVRLLHAGVPSAPARSELKGRSHANLTIRRCSRLHAKAVVVDAASMYLGSANLTGAGLGAKADERRNFEWGMWTSSPPLIDAVLHQFNALWEGQRCKDCGRRDVCPVPLEEPT